MSWAYARALPEHMRGSNATYVRTNVRTDDSLTLTSSVGFSDAHARIPRFDGLREIRGRFAPRSEVTA